VLQTPLAAAIRVMITRVRSEPDGFRQLLGRGAGTTYILSTFFAPSLEFPIYGRTRVAKKKKNDNYRARAVGSHGSIRDDCADFVRLHYNAA